MTLNDLISESLWCQMMTSRKIGKRKESGFKKKNGLQIITRKRVRFNIREMLLHRLSPICVSMSNSLIFNFANKKNEYGKKYIQSAVLRERQQGERRYCPHHGTSDNQRYCGAVQLQADHPENPLGCERQPSQRQECRSNGTSIWHWTTSRRKSSSTNQRISDREAIVTAENGAQCLPRDR